MSIAKPNMIENTNRNNTGGMEWGSAPGRMATPEEADMVRDQFGPGWHEESMLFRGGMTGELLFALLRANFIRLDGWRPMAGGPDEPVYLIFF